MPIKVLFPTHSSEGQLLSGQGSGHPAAHTIYHRSSLGAHSQSQGRCLCHDRNASAKAPEIHTRFSATLKALGKQSLLAPSHYSNPRAYSPLPLLLVLCRPEEGVAFWGKCPLVGTGEAGHGFSGPFKGSLGKGTFEGLVR